MPKPLLPRTRNSYSEELEAFSVKLEASLELGSRSSNKYIEQFFKIISHSKFSSDLLTPVWIRIRIQQKLGYESEFTEYFSHL